MCKWDITLEMPVQVWTNQPNYPIELELQNQNIDACLAPLIYKLNQNQVTTLKCCCGHMQDKRFNLIYNNKSVHAGASIVIDPNCTRHTDSMGFYVKYDEKFASFEL